MDVEKVNQKLKETICTICGVLTGFLCLICFVGVLASKDIAGKVAAFMFAGFFLSITIFFFRKVKVKLPSNSGALIKDGKFDPMGILWVLGTAALFGIPFYFAMMLMIKTAEKRADKNLEEKEKAIEE